MSLEVFRAVGSVVIVLAGLVWFWMWVQRTPSAGPEEWKENHG
jgi:hypothetical protein